MSYLKYQYMVESRENGWAVVDSHDISFGLPGGTGNFFLSVDYKQIGEPTTLDAALLEAIELNTKGNLWATRLNIL